MNTAQNKKARHEIVLPLPADAQTNANGRVFIQLNDGNKVRRKVIGSLAGDAAAAETAAMRPLNTFRELYPRLWSARNELHLGTYALLLSLGHATGLYPVLADNLGAEKANALMDLVLADRNTGKTGQHCFSGELPSQAWYADFLACGLAAEDLLKVRLAWTRACAESGHNTVWLRVCLHEDAGSDDAAGDSLTIVRAVSSRDGLPVSWAFSRGTCLDGHCLREMKDFLAQFGITVQGVLLDAENCTHEVAELLREHNCQYLARLKPGSPAFKSLLERHAAGLRWNVEHRIGDRTASSALFGLTDRLDTPGPAGEQQCAALFFDAAQASRESLAFLADMDRARAELADRLANGQAGGPAAPGAENGAGEGSAAEAVSIPEELAPWLALEEQDGRQVVVCRHEAWQAKLDQAGFAAFLSSADMAAADILAICSLVDPADGRTLATLPRTATTPTALESKYLACFVADILDNRIRRLCRRLSLDNGQLDAGLEDLYLVLFQGRYAFIQSPGRDEPAPIPEALGFDRKALATVARLVNMQAEARREGKPFTNFVNTFPLKPGSRKALADDDRPQGGRRGRRASKLQARRDLFALVAQGGQVTIEMLVAAGLTNPEESAQTAQPGSGTANVPGAAPQPAAPGHPAPATMSTAPQGEPVKRGRGRPKGSKNRKTLEREAMLAAAGQQAQPQAPVGDMARITPPMPADYGQPEQARTEPAATVSPAEPIDPAPADAPVGDVPQADAGQGSIQ